MSPSRHGPEPGFRRHGAVRHAGGAGLGPRDRRSPAPAAQARFLRAGRAAVDDCDLLELLLSGRSGCRASTGALAAQRCWRSFGTAPRGIGRPVPTGCVPCPASSEDAVAIRSRPPRRSASAWPGRRCRETVRPSFGNYDKVIDYCRTLAGPTRGRGVPHLLYLEPEEPCWSPTSCHQNGSRSATPRSIQGRSACAALELRASAVIAVFTTTRPAEPEAVSGPTST